MKSSTTPRGIVIPPHALRFTFVRSGGPGGQHVNTSSTKVRVQIDIDACELSVVHAQRLHEIFGRCVNASASSSRSQWQNREEAIRRAFLSIDEALSNSRPRIATKVTRRAKERRLNNKSRQARRKADRRWNGDD